VIESVDLNSDGLIDLVVCYQGIPDTSDHRPLLIFLNTDNGRQFAISSGILMNECYFPIVIGDFDNDGRQNDISTYANAGMLLIETLVDYENGVSGLYTYLLHRPPVSQTKGRFNDDELDDLALIIPETNTLEVLLAYGGGSSVKTFFKEIYFTANHSTSITRIKFNNDQIDDLAVLSCNRTVTIFIGTPSGFFDKNYLSFEFNRQNSTQCAHSLKVADLNQDGIDDLVFIDAEIHSIAVLLATTCDQET
jgi:hypothetical protein